MSGNEKNPPEQTTNDKKDEQSQGESQTNDKPTGGRQGNKKANRTGVPVRTVCRVKCYYNNIMYTPGKPGPVFIDAIPEDAPHFVEA